MALNRRAVGTAGEDTAASYLRSQGYAVLERNFRLRTGEIDCIARDPAGTLVFIEVKRARSGSCGHPLSWVSPVKQRQVARLAQIYMATRRMAGPCRFDVIAVTPKGVDHLKNAFLAV